MAGAYDFLPLTNPDTRPAFFHPNYPRHTQPIEFAGPEAPRTVLGAAVNDSLIKPQRNSVGPREQAAIGGCAGDAPTLADVTAFIEGTPPRP